MAHDHLVLVVEDEPLIRAVTVCALEDDGFSILEAASGDLALPLLYERDDIRALIADVEMPGQTDGLALAKIARELRPELPIIIVSGRIRPTVDMLAFDARFLAKPFSPTQLASMVRELISDQR